MYTDPSGHVLESIKYAIKWIAKNIGKPVVKTIQKHLSCIDLTCSSGINISGTPSFWIFNGQAGLSIDTKGNVAVQASGGDGLTVGTPSVAASFYGSITNAPSINELNGSGYQIGKSVLIPTDRIPIVLGNDFNIIPDTQRHRMYYGTTYTIGTGYGSPGGEFHIEWGETGTIRQTQFNLFNIARYI